MIAAGGVADICARVLDAQGHELSDSALRDRSIAISTEQLRRVPEVIAVAGGVHRAEAIAGVLRSGLVHRLATDDRTAAAVLERPD